MSKLQGRHWMDRASSKVAGCTTCSFRRLRTFRNARYRGEEALCVAWRRVRVVGGCGAVFRDAEEGEVTHYEATGLRVTMAEVLGRGREGGEASGDPQGRVPSPDPRPVVGEEEAEAARVYEYRNGFGKTEEAESVRRGKISTANSGRVPWNVGMPHKVATRRKIRQSLRETYTENPALAEVIRSRQQGKKHSEATRKKIRAARMVHVSRQKMAREKRDMVKSVWSGLLEIQERRESLYNLRKLERVEKKLRQKEASAQRRRAASLAKKSRGLASGGGGERQSGQPKSEEHRRKISEAMKKKWREKEYRTSVSASAKKRHESRKEDRGVTPDFGAKKKKKVSERNLMLKKQERLRQRAAELLAQAHQAAKHLKEIEAEESNGNGEIREALRSLQDADALVNRLHKSAN
ncbi:hypothetical protein HOP50_19g84700 [Chloropicon primus]|uniref:Nuclease associated modular domain-containing protein n=2 Tax=Chloropicon primus TaxID=1764295 RepID=A0A5B8N037_9CHLO|nr:hypothetical protein A3770_19p84390 [Chloropicon primus]UPR05122.1 hypothetical protein HOP50_19g84700 [Chloropicon primus]|eukprot:QDZ25921.1 hypothetical protein A3770_19p84390 [Chloropicon primus]